MNYPFLVIAAFAMMIAACGEQKPAPDKATQPTDTTKTAAAEPQPYFPVYSFLREEINLVDSLPVGIKKYTTVGSKTDSGYMQMEEFHQLTSQFLTPELKDSTFEKKFKETSFMDRTSNAGTFLYTSTDSANTIKRIDVITAKGEIYDEARSLYMEKSYRSGDTSVTKKLIWKPKRNFQLVTLTNIPSKPVKSELIKVVWDNRE